MLYVSGLAHFDFLQRRKVWGVLIDPLNFHNFYEIQACKLPILGIASLGVKISSFFGG